MEEASLENIFSNPGLEQVATQILIYSDFSTIAKCLRLSKKVNQNLSENKKIFWKLQMEKSWLKSSLFRFLDGNERFGHKCAPLKFYNPKLSDKDSFESMKSFFGEFDQTFNSILTRKFKVAFSYHRYLPPLYAVCYLGSLKTVKLLYRFRNHIGLKLWNPETYDLKYSPLHYACEGGFYEIIDFLCDGQTSQELGLDWNIRDDNGKAPISYACEQHHGRVIELLLRSSSDLKIHFSPSVQHQFEKLFRRLCDQSDYWFIEMLCQNAAKIGFNINAQRRSTKDRTALHEACVTKRNPDLELVKILCNHKISTNLNPNIVDEFGRTALHYACFHGHFEIVKKLCWIDADIKIADRDGHTPLTSAMEQFHYEIVDFLLNNHPFDDIANTINKKTGWNLLHYACCYNFPNVVNVFLNPDYLIHWQAIDPNGETPSSVALVNGHIEIIKALYRSREISKINFASKDLSGWTSLHYAVQYGFHDLIDFMYAKQDILNTNWNAADKDGLTPLHLACQSKSPEAMIKLCRYAYKCKIDWNSKDNFGRSPFHLICENFSLPTVEQFLDYCSYEILCEEARNKIYLNAKDDQGCTPLHYACCNGQAEIVEFYCFNADKINFDWNDKDDSGFTPIHYACKTENSAIIELLLENRQRLGIDMTVRDANGKDLFEYAYEIGLQHRCLRHYQSEMVSFKRPPDPCTLRKAKIAKTE